jgi:hypothetical protein
MAFEKKYTAKQTAQAVLDKVSELLGKSTLTKVEKLENTEVNDENSLNKSEGDKIREMQKHGLSPEQIKTKMKKDEDMEKHGLSPEEIKAKMKKSEGYPPQNSKKENAKPSEHDSKNAYQHAEGKGPKGEIHPKEHAEGGTDGKSAEVNSQTPPGNNEKEKAEGNNELAGTTPTQVGQDGKNVPGGDEIKGHLKLAKFIGRMEHKRTLKPKPLSGDTTQKESTAQHRESISTTNE